MAGFSMRAFSLTQPWASLVVFHEKKWETRSFRLPRHLYGVEIALHASKGFPRYARELVNDSFTFEAALRRHGITKPGDLPLGVILGTITFDKCEPTSLLATRASRDWYGLPAQEYDFGNYDEGRYAWRVARVRRLVEPVPCKGSLGFWTVPEAVEAQFRFIDAPEERIG
jgi:hypothetical protein